MASNTTIAGVLAFLHELFPTREISDKTLDAWRIVFADWSDDEFTSCAHAAAKEPDRTFFPTPGEIAAFRTMPVIDVDAVLARIAALGRHNPRSGWIYPRPDRIRDVFGEAIANAYVDAGGDLLFAQESNDGATITRDIARRAFATALAQAQRRHPDRPLILPPEPPPLLLADTTERPVPPTVVTRTVLPRELPTTPAGKIKLAKEYRAERETAGQVWAVKPQNAERYLAIRIEVDATYAEFGGIARYAHVAFSRCADCAGFPTFEEWTAQRANGKRKGNIEIDLPTPVPTP